MPILYRFSELKFALTVLETGTFKASRLAELNDIFDCCPQFDTSRIFHTGLSDKEWAMEINKRNNQNIGVICFSKQCVSPLLWGHYSASATGLALGFDQDCLESQYVKRIEVEYSKNRPKVVWPNRYVSTEHDDELFQKSFGVKAKEWSYEEEVRFVIRLESCSTSNGLYFVDWPPASLREVVIGARANVDGLYLERFLRNRYPRQKIEIKRASIDDVKYEMKLDGIDDSETYRRDGDLY